MLKETMPLIWLTCLVVGKNQIKIPQMVVKHGNSETMLQSKTKKSPVIYKASK